MRVIYEKTAKYATHESSKFQNVLILLVIGFLIIVAGIIILIVAAVCSDKSVNFGACVFIGPFPIVVGAGPEAMWMVLFAIIFAVFSIIVLLILHREMKRTDA